MTRRELIERLKTACGGLYGPGESRNIATIVAEELFGVEYPDLLRNPEGQVGIVAEELDRIANELAAGRPVQYVIGHWEFDGLDFSVNENVLIPRPETEELVRWVRDEWKVRSHEADLLDIGTGSGCIAVALAHNPGWKSVTAVDISARALDVAKANAQRNQVRIETIQCDVLQEEIPGRYDVIVSNPPYVRLSARAQMQANVLDYEPPVALFVDDDDPLLFYRTIARQGQRILREGGMIYFEINEALAPDMRTMLEWERYADIEMRRDIYDKPRMMRCRKR